MEMTIDQALQQGVAAHKEGKLQDAERHYRSILQIQPAHPDANHNLGVLSVTLDNAEAALTLFKTALEASPKTEQFWLSYINALIRVNQLDEARRVLDQARKQGVDEGRLGRFKAEIAQEEQNSNASGAGPPQELLDRLLQHYKNGRFNDAEKLAITITREFPTHNFSWKILAAVYAATSRYTEAVDASRTAVGLAPRDAEAHSNLGNTLMSLGRLNEASASYRQALVLKPNYAEAHYNLGNALKELGKLSEAVASYNQAVVGKHDYTDAYYNLGIVLQELGRLDESVSSFKQAIALKPDFAEAHSDLGRVLLMKGQHRIGLGEVLLGDGSISFDLENGLSIL